jgi:polyhydroxyalkanoate synthesis regulator phasin
MAQNDTLKRYLDAGAAFTQLTRSRAEAIVKDLVKAGELQREQTQAQVEELIERSRRNTEQLVDLVRKEVAAQFKQLGVVTKVDLARIEGRLSSFVPGRAPAKRVAKKAAAPAKKAATTAKKSAPAKKAASTTKKAVNKAAAPAKKAAAPAKKSAKRASGVKKA